MSGMMTSKNGLEVTRTVGLTEHKTTYKWGTWFWIPKLATYGVLRESGTMFSEFATLYVPFLDKLGSFTTDQIEVVEELSDDGYNLVEGTLVVINQRYLRDHPLQFADSAYTVSHNDVGIIRETTPYYARIQFTELSERRNETMGTIGECVSPSELVWSKDATEDERENDPTLADYGAICDPDLFDGETVLVVFEAAIPGYAADNNQWWDYPFQECGFCQECGMLDDTDSLTSSDETSLTCLRGEPMLTLCDGCQEGGGEVYTFETFGYEATNSSCRLSKHTGYLEDSDTVQEFVNSYDFITDTSSSQFLQLFNLTAVLSDSVRAHSDFLLAVREWHYEDRSCVFTLLTVNDDYYIDCNWVCGFAAFLLKMEKRGYLAQWFGKEVATAACLLAEWMPTVPQIVAWFKDGKVPVFLNRSQTPRIGLVTLEDLRKLRACAEQRRKFLRLFPNGCWLLPDNVTYARRNGLQVEWWADHAHADMRYDINAFDIELHDTKSQDNAYSFGYFTHQLKHDADYVLLCAPRCDSYTIYSLKVQAPSATTHFVSVETMLPGCVRATCQDDADAMVQSIHADDPAARVVIIMPDKEWHPRDNCGCASL